MILHVIMDDIIMAILVLKVSPQSITINAFVYLHTLWRLCRRYAKNIQRNYLMIFFTIEPFFRIKMPFVGMSSTWNVL